MKNLDIKISKEIISAALIAFLLIFSAVFVNYSTVYSWGASNESDNDRDCLDDNPNTADNADGSCDECGNGSWGGYDSSYCEPVMIGCFSQSNICGWSNEGKQDVSCGGSCSAMRPADPEFEINGETKKVGDSCIVRDSCGLEHQGTVSCEGSCLSTDNINPLCALPDNPDTTEDESAGHVVIGNDSFSTSISANLRLPDNLNLTYPRDENNAEKYVAIYSMPPIVKQGQRAKLYLVLVGLDYCEVSADNADRWDYFGLKSEKLEYIKKKSPDIELGLDDEIRNLSFLSSTYSSPIETETIFKVEKCYSLDHYGDASEYIPSAEEGDKPETRVKVTPRFQEI